MTFCGVNGNFIPRISVSDHAHTWICCKDSFQSDGCLGRAVCNDDLARVLAVAHANAAAVMEGRRCQVYLGAASRLQTDPPQAGPLREYTAEHAQMYLRSGADPTVPFSAGFQTPG